MDHEPELVTQPGELLDQFKCGLDPFSCIDVVFITDGHSNGALDVCHEVECLYNHPSHHINTYAIGINNYNATEMRCLSNSEEVVFGFGSLNEFEGYLKNVTMRLLTPVNRLYTIDAYWHHTTFSL